MANGSARRLRQNEGVFDQCCVIDVAPVFRSASQAAQLEEECVHLHTGLAVGAAKTKCLRTNRQEW